MGSTKRKHAFQGAGTEEKAEDPMEAASKKKAPKMSGFESLGLAPEVYRYSRPISLLATLAANNCTGFIEGTPTMLAQRREEEGLQGADADPEEGDATGT